MNNQPILRAVLLIFVLGCGESTVAPEYGDGCEGSCPSLSCLEDSFFPGGLCTEPCDESECGPGGVCDARFGPALCLASCSDDTECREGWDCWRSACQPACTRAAECGEGGSCVEGHCEGAECATDTDCATGACRDGSCAPLVDMGPPVECTDSCDGVCLNAAHGGGCAARCADLGDCPAGTNCAPVATDTDGDGRVDQVDPACVPFNDSGRFVGGTCSGSVPGSTQCDSRVCFQGQCAIACDDDADCLAGQTCQDVAWDDATVTTCFDAPGLANGELELARGTLRSGAQGMATFAVPRQATSVAFVLRQMDGSDLPLTFVEVVDPTETRIFDLAAISRLEDQPIRWLPLDTHEIASMLVPNSTPDRVTFRNGRHRISWAAFGDEGGEIFEGDVRVVARFASGNGRTLRLQVHLAAGIGVTAASAPTTTRLQNALSTMAATYAAAGVTVEVAGYDDVAGSQFTVIDSTEGPTSELAQLFDRGTAAGDVLDVFFVRAIDTPDGNPLGVAGGIPGPPGEHATPSSGVVVAYDSGVVGGSSNLGQIVAHECGHYLGLFHSTENGSPCAPGQLEGCSPFGGGDPISDTTRGDNRNMMYFALQTFGGGTTNNRISTGQGFVMQRNPLVLR